MRGIEKRTFARKGEMVLMLVISYWPIWPMRGRRGLLQTGKDSAVLWEWWPCW